jgi:hypothetical protein
MAYFSPFLGSISGKKFPFGRCYYRNMHDYIKWSITPPQANFDYSWNLLSPKMSSDPAKVGTSKFLNNDIERKLAPHSIAGVRVPRVLEYFKSTRMRQQRVVR